MLEAVDAWVDRGLSAYVIGSTLTAMVAKNDPSGRQMMDEQKAKYESDKAVSKERSIMLKAKLLMLKDKLDVVDLTS